MEMLMHHANSVRKRRLGRGNSDWFAVKNDIPFVGLIQPIKDSHQSCLAGSVFSKQAVDFAAPNNEIDPIVGNDSREPLYDSPELNSQWNASFGSHSTPVSPSYVRVVLATMGRLS